MYVPSTLSAAHSSSLLSCLQPLDSDCCVSGFESGVRNGQRLYLPNAEQVHTRPKAKIENR